MPLPPFLVGGRLALLDEPQLADGRLHLVPDAPVFERAAYLITSDAASANWTWLPDLVERLSH